MPGGETFFPPVQFSPLWGLLAFALLAIVVAWYVFVLVLTRRKPLPQVAQFDYPRLSSEVRQSYLSRIDDVGARYAAGGLTFSAAHHELSHLVRSFAAESRGIRAQFMTLDDLRHTPHRDLAATVEALYPGAFSGDERGSIADSASRAAHLVRQWN